MNRYSVLTGLEEVRSNWGWFLVLGIALIVLGVVALGAVWLFTLASVLLFGWLLIFGGVFEAIASFFAGRWSGFLLNLFVGILYAVGGVLILRHPLVSAAGLTLVLASLFLAGGLFRMIAAATLRYHSWGWAVLDGLVAVIVGGMIWAAWPSSALWTIGTFLGIVLLFRGWSWVMFGLGARHLPRTIEGRGSEGIRPAA